MAHSAKSKVRSIFRENLFRDKVAIVTGGATGIGKTIAQELLYLGCNVMIGSRKPERLEKAAREMSKTQPPGRVEWQECNIRKEDHVKNLIETTLSRFGRIDFLVNNGGGQFYSPASQFNLKGWNAVLETNLTGTFLCCKEVYHQWMETNGGVIVNIIAEMQNGMPGMCHSGAARAGVENMTKTLALEWSANGIRLNCVCPGNSIKSPTAEANYGPNFKGIFERNLPYIPLGRLGRPEEISAAVCYLLSPAASFVTGTTMVIDGGELLHAGKWPTEVGDKTKPYAWDIDESEQDVDEPKSKL